jgi:hypothetical protein
MMRKIIRNKYVRPLAYVVGGKMMVDMSYSGYFFGKESFNSSSPSKLSAVPLVCAISGLASFVTSGIIITGAPFAIPMYTYNHFTNKQENEPYYDLITFAATMFRPNDH